MARAIAVSSPHSSSQDGIWLNRFWTNRHPTPEVLDKIAETLGGDLTFFDDNPRTVISVVRVLTQGRKFRMSEHPSVHPDDIPGLIEQAKSLK